MGTREQQHMVMGYRELRRIVGVLGLCYPILLAVYCKVSDGCPELQTSVSAYYHTVSQDLFVGVLFSIAVFMLAYKGPDLHNHWDNLAGKAACVFAMGVALFPTASDHPDVSRFVGIVHGVASGALFVTLALFSLLLFTRTHKNANPGIRKRQRNGVYRICGILILLCIGLIGAYKLFDGGQVLPSVLGVPVVYGLETLALLAFGFSWLIKGETFLKD